MAKRSNGGMRGVQNRTTSAVAAGAWSMDDVQQSTLARNWPGQPSAQVPNSPSFANAVSFSAYISGTNMTVTAVSSGTLAANQFVTGLGVSQYTKIVSQTSGTTGGAGVYVVNISQTVGSSGAPVAMNVNLSLASNTSVSIPYLLGYDGGSPTTSVTAIVYSGSTPVGTTTGASSPLVVTGLPSGTVLSTSLYATNSIGNSVPSTGPYFKTPGVPAAPTIGTATLQGSSSASVTFTAPTDDGGSAITSYTVVASSGGYTATGTSSPITITGLAYSTTYTFTVYATNAIGDGASSASSNSITTASGPIAVVVDTLVVAGGASGGYGYAGGGGGGGMRYFTGISVNDGTSLPIVVGGGGASVSTLYAAGNSGSPSYFLNTTYQSAGGGAGGAYSYNAVAGGAGGGAGNYVGNLNVNGAAGNTPSTTPSQGANGGNDAGGWSGGGGGGGGASGVAGSPSYQMPATSGQYNFAGGNGGNGTANSITGTSTYYAGGGGGGAATNATPAYQALGGLGGGGPGSKCYSGSVSGQSYSQTGNTITLTIGGGASSSYTDTPVGGSFYISSASGGLADGCYTVLTKSSPTFTLYNPTSDTFSGTATVSCGSPGGNGSVNTGGGGGGGPDQQPDVADRKSGSGGSGVVFVRSLNSAVATTGSPIHTTSGSYHIYQFNNNGSITF